MKINISKSPFISFDKWEERIKICGFTDLTYADYLRCKLIYYLTPDYLNSEYLPMLHTLEFVTMDDIKSQALDLFEQAMMEHGERGTNLSEYLNYCTEHDLFNIFEFSPILYNDYIERMRGKQMMNEIDEIYKRFKGEIK